MSVVGQQLDLVAVIHIHSDDESARLTIGFEEEALDVVDDSVTNNGKLHVVQRVVEVRRAGFACGVTWRRVWHRSVVERKIVARVI